MSTTAQAFIWGVIVGILAFATYLAMVVEFGDDDETDDD
jgi:hypothetical protein